MYNTDRQFEIRRLLYECEYYPQFSVLFILLLLSRSYKDNLIGIPQ